MENRHRTRHYLALAISVATFIVYLKSLQNGSVGWWDDDAYVFANPHLRSFDLTFLKWAFFGFYLWNWHPLTWLSHVLDYTLWSTHPLGHHLTNNILHAGNTFLVVIVTMTLLESVNQKTARTQQHQLFDGQSVLVAGAVTGLLFGLHPLHVESVAWISERKDLLCAFFFLLSCMAYLKFARSRPAEKISAPGLPVYRQKSYILSCIFFVLALMSKPMAMTLPIVLVIVDWYPLERIYSFDSFRAAIVEKLPFMVFALLSLVLTFLAQSAGGAVASAATLPLAIRLPVAAKALIEYLRKMILPYDLAPFYPYPREVSLLSPGYVLAIMIGLVITILCLALARRRKLWLSAWSYYVATLAPVLGIVQVGGQAMADRYTYLPSIGPFIVLGILSASLAKKLRSSGPRGGMRQLVSAALAALLILSLSYLTLRQISIWKSDLTLWDYAITRGFESSTAYNNRGLAYDRTGRRSEAVADFTKAIALDPLNYLAYNNLGMSFGKKGAFQKSIECFMSALAINPKHADTYYNLGLSYFYLGRYDDALDKFTAAVKLDDHFAAAYLQRGNLYSETGNRELAAADYRKACDLGNGAACGALQ